MRQDFNIRSIHQNETLNNNWRLLKYSSDKKLYVRNDIWKQIVEELLHITPNPTTITLRAY